VPFIDPAPLNSRTYVRPTSVPGDVRDSVSSEKSAFGDCWNRRKLAARNLGRSVPVVLRVEEMTGRPNPSRQGAVYSLGYQGRDLDEVLALIQSHEIEQVIDVRGNAFSRKPGFSGPAFREALALVGVGYLHLPELGCALTSRHALWRGGSRESFLEEYRRRLADHSGAFATLVERIGSRRTMLICLERDPERCHRAVLEQKLREEGILTRDL
jgi:hypothetical protein